MPSVSRRAAASVVVALGVSLTGGVAFAASTGAYSGRTSQRQPVSLSISGGRVHSFKITVNDRCPDGHTLSFRSAYPAMTINRGSFGGSFAPVGGHHGEGASLRGKIGRRGVTGSISDTSYSPREGALCHGSATFSAHHT